MREKTQPQTLTGRDHFGEKCGKLEDNSKVDIKTYKMN
jgi:hypothetical protein